MYYKLITMKRNQNGFGVIEIVIVVAFLSILGFGGYFVYKSSNEKNNESTANQSQQNKPVYDPKEDTVCKEVAPGAKTEDKFTELPFKLDQLKVITIGKETNDSRFVYPWVKTATTDKTEIFAPATGKLFVIRHKVYEIDGKKGNDYDMFFEVDCNTVYRFNHISNPRDDIKAAYPAGDLPSGDYANGGLDMPERIKPKTAITVKAGESLGYTTGTPIAHNFDFAVGISTSRETERLAVCPLSVFSESNNAKLLALLGPKSTGVPQPGYKCDIESKTF